MTPRPTPDADTPGAVQVHRVAGDPPVDVRVERRGADAEIELLRSRTVGGEPTSIDAVVTEIRTLVADPALDGVSWHLAADHPAETLDPMPEAVADALGLAGRRDLLQLRRPLPVPPDQPARRTAPQLAVRAFRPGGDDQRWISTNNRAFADHPDQGHETTATLAARMAEPWFDPAGFLVADDPQRPAELSGFCWTKTHPPTDTDPELGEIYVIGVDPARQGEGLGPSFVLAGLDHLADQGIGVANLYVDADNQPARRLYDRLGFTVHQRRRVYTP